MSDENRDRELEWVLGSHGPALARLAASYESRPALREELMQDIAFALWRALPSFRHEASEKTFVMRIATNRALSHLAARRSHEETFASVESQEVDVPCATPRPDELAARQQAAERLQRAVRRLPLPFRQVLVLAFEGLGNEEIASVLGISPGNVGVRLHRGKALLRAALGETT